MTKIQPIRNQLICWPSGEFEGEYASNSTHRTLGFYTFITHSFLSLIWKYGTETQSKSENDKKLLKSFKRS